MNYYLAIKHLHVACVILSGAGFFLRGVRMFGDAPPPRSRWLAMAPHVNDTVLLAAAMALMVLTNQYPFVDAWVTAKVFGLIGYIILGSVALKAGRTRPARIAAWLAALAVFAYVVSVALTKSPWGFVTWLGG